MNEQSKKEEEVSEGRPILKMSRHHIQMWFKANNGKVCKQWEHPFLTEDKKAQQVQLCLEQQAEMLSGRPVYYSGTHNQFVRTVLWQSTFFFCVGSVGLLKNRILLLSQQFLISFCSSMSNFLFGLLSLSEMMLSHSTIIGWLVLDPIILGNTGNRCCYRCRHNSSELIMLTHQEVVVLFILPLIPL